MSCSYVPTYMARIVVTFSIYPEVAASSDEESASLYI